MRNIKLEIKKRRKHENITTKIKYKKLSSNHFSIIYPMSN